MEKILSKSLLAVFAACLVTTSFVACSDGDDDTTTVEQKKEVTTTTKTVKIGDNTYTYTIVDGQPQSGTGVTVNADGTVTVAASDGSSVTFSADGSTITYKTADNKTYTGSASTTESDNSSVTLTSESGETISAESKSETETETEATTGSEAAATVRELQYSDSSLDGKVFKYNDDGNTRYYKFEGGKVYKSSDKTYWKDKSDDFEEDGKYIISWGTGYGTTDMPALPRTSGSGLYSTFSFSEGEYFVSFTFKSDGTGTWSMNAPKEGSMSGTLTFTNNKGELKIVDETEEDVYIYTGNSLYVVDDLLIEEK